MEIPLLQDVTIILALSIVVLFICHQVRLPTVVGFLLTGIFVGPHGLALIEGVDEVEILAEIGVVLLLFAIGLEFSFKELSRLKKAVLLGGSLQVVLTVFAAFAISLKLGEVPKKAIFIGFIVALSSTAVVLKIFQEKAEVETPHGRTALAIRRDGQISSNPEGNTVLCAHDLVVLIGPAGRMLDAAGLFQNVIETQEAVGNHLNPS
jgi:CPA2 family monovalent cation:H+ antiporter-2